MRILMWVLGGLVGLLSTLGIAQWVASESGEVVILTTHDEAGASHETRLWVVDHEGAPWLRAGASVQGWYARLAAEPQIEVERNGTQAAYTALPEPALRELINGLMLTKYGWADQFIGVLFGRDDAIPIRLEAASH